MVFFESNHPKFPEKLSETMIDDWFADMKQENIKYIVFTDKIYKYEIGNQKEKEIILEALRERGFQDSQFNWAE